MGARIYALLNVVKGMAEIEMLALNSKESSRTTRRSIASGQTRRSCPSFESCWSRTASTWIVFRCSWHPAGSSISSSGCREKRSPCVQLPLPHRKELKDNGFTVRRATEEDLKRMLGVYFEQNVTTERYEDHDGERWVLFGE